MSDATNQLKGETMTRIIETAEVFEAIKTNSTFAHIILVKKTGAMTIKTRSGKFLSIDPVEDIWDEIVTQNFC